MRDRPYLQVFFLDYKCHYFGEKRENSLVNKHLNSSDNETETIQNETANFFYQNQVIQELNNACINNNIQCIIDILNSIEDFFYSTEKLDVRIIIKEQILPILLEMVQSNKNEEIRYIALSCIDCAISSNEFVVDILNNNFTFFQMLMGIWNNNIEMENDDSEKTLMIIINILKNSTMNQNWLQQIFELGFFEKICSFAKEIIPNSFDEKDEMDLFINVIEYIKLFIEQQDIPENLLKEIINFFLDVVKPDLNGRILFEIVTELMNDLFISNPVFWFVVYQETEVFTRIINLIGYESFDLASHYHALSLIANALDINTEFLWDIIDVSSMIERLYEISILDKDDQLHKKADDEIGVSCRILTLLTEKLQKVPDLFDINIISKSVQFCLIGSKTDNRICCVRLLMHIIYYGTFDEIEYLIDSMKSSTYPYMSMFIDLLKDMQNNVTLEFVTLIQIIIEKFGIYDETHENYTKFLQGEVLNFLEHCVIDNTIPEIYDLAILLLNTYYSPA